jgi:hypothetical protein
MAETKNPDIGKLIADALANASSAKAAREEAKRKANEIKTKNDAELRVKITAQNRVKYAEGLQGSIDTDLQVIKQLLRKQETQELSATDVRDLQYYANRYQSTLDAQTKAYQESKDLAAGKYQVDTSGKLTTKSGASVGSSSEDSDGDGIPNVSDNLPNFPNPNQATGKVGGGPTIVEQAVGGDTGKKTGGDTGGNTGGNTGGTGTKEKPYTKNGKPFTGTANGKTYQSGVVIDPNALTTEQQAKLGEYGSKYLIDYFKASYPDIYNKLLTMARAGESAANVEGYLSGTAWAKDVNQRTYALIGAAELSNGIKLDQVTKDTYRDQYLAKVKSMDEIKYDIGLKTIAQFQLDTVKPDIANSIRAGNTFALAAADYIEIYRKNLEIASSAFKVDDKNFQTLLISSANISDFEKKLRRTDQYLSQPKVQQQINSNKIMVTTKYRQFGLSLTAAAADNLAKNVFLGDTSNEQIDENLRQEAVKLFPAFRDRILNGESPLSIASPYLGAISRILEVPEGSLDLEDPTVRKAMMGSTTTLGDKTSSTVTPLWQFEQDLYKDSRWQYTANARAKADSILVDVGSRFGVIP